MKPIRSVLMIAFQFPPFAGSSGVQRTLRFAQYLPQHGWRPIVLTAAPRAYPEAGVSEVGNEVSAKLEVHRAFCLDAARHLAFCGRYPQALAIPDRWASWRPFAKRLADKLIRNNDISAVWSTFPIATAHTIGRDVATTSGLPWVAEFRDPMWQGTYPSGARMNAAWKALETDVFAIAKRVVVATPGARDIYLHRFPSFPKDSLAVIHNGFDEAVFRRAESALEYPMPSTPEPVKLLHSGIIYPSERDPTQFLAAIASLKRKGQVSGKTLQVVLRASGYESELREVVDATDIIDIVRIEPAISYLEAVKEMLTADGLLVLQASNCNAQVPAKLYEYLRSGRPILALTDPIGDTARTVLECGGGTVAPLDSQERIEEALMELVAMIRGGRTNTAIADVVAKFSRERSAMKLAQLLDGLT